MAPYLDGLEMPRSELWPPLLDDNAAHGRVGFQQIVGEVVEAVPE